MKVVVAIDGEQSAKTALDHILKGKYDANTFFNLVHVMTPGFADAPVQGIPDVTGIEREEEQAILAQMKSSLEKKLGAIVNTNILPGEIAEVIADECKRFGADEAIVPSHARHGFSRLWFGSVADEIVDATDCTVVVLKMPHTNRTPSH